MYDKELRLLPVESSEPVLSKEERYELIAMAAKRINAANRTEYVSSNPFSLSENLDCDLDDFQGYFN